MALRSHFFAIIEEKKWVILAGIAILFTGYRLYTRTRYEGQFILRCLLFPNKCLSRDFIKVSERKGRFASGFMAPINKLIKKILEECDATCYYKNILTFIFNLLGSVKLK